MRATTPIEKRISDFENPMSPAWRPPTDGLPQTASHRRPPTDDLLHIASKARSYMMDQAAITALSSRKSSMPWAPHSRPLPDCL
jgi:hypothetical protein